MAKQPASKHMAAGELATKHLREPIDDEDGTRIHISRRWPRGVAKGERFTEWMKALAPSTEWLDAYLHEDLGWERYTERFLQEMEGEQAQERIRELAARVRGGETVTLLCDHPRDAPEAHCHRFLVDKFVQQGIL